MSNNDKQQTQLSVRCTKCLDSAGMCAEIARLMNTPNAQILYLNFVAMMPQQGIDPSKVKMIDLWRAFYIIPSDTEDKRTKTATEPFTPKIVT